MRYLIECSYKGTAFHGWQKQPNATSVQENIEEALSMVLKNTIDIVGSSRTDTGVHAEQQFAHFDVDVPILSTAKLAHSINGILPKGIAIKQILAVKDNFHSRFDATHRRYLYRILPTKNPFWSELSYYFHSNLDIEKMNLTGEILKKYIDFQCFSKVNTDVMTFNCNIDVALWEYQDDFLLFHIKADRFLRGMVRAIVGTMIEVGAGRLSLEDFENIILSKNRGKAGRAVPAEGLTLMEVGYSTAK